MKKLYPVVKFPALYFICSFAFYLASSKAEAQCFTGAADFTTNATGNNWSVGSHWSGGTSPGCNIATNNTKVEVRTNTTVFSASCPTLRMDGDNTALHVVNNSTLTIEGDFSPSGEFACIYVEAGSTLIVQGSFILNSASANLMVNGSMQVGGNLIIANELATINVNGSLAVTGEINCAAPLCEPGATTFTGSGTITAGGGCTGDFGTECDDALPVRLLYFNVTEKENKVSVIWATSMEEHFSHFVVQRSSDGLAFKDIGEVPGQGFNIYDIVSKYIFEDEAPLLGFNYYRLKAVDLNGSFEYFGVQATRVAGPKRMAVYPNPSGGETISFRINFTSEETDQIILIDQLGIEVYKAPATVAESNIAFGNALRPGIYMLRYVSKDFQQVTRLLVQN